MRLYKILTLFLVIALSFSIPVKSADAFSFGSDGGFFGDITNSFNSFTGSFSSNFGTDLTGFTNNVFTSLGDSVNGLFGGTGGNINIGAPISNIGSSILGVPVAVGGGNINIVNSGLDILTGIASGNSLGDAAGNVLDGILGGVTTSNPALNSALRTALGGGDIGDVLTSFGSTFLSGFTTGNTSLDRLIRTALGGAGGFLGDIFGSFGITSAGGCGGNGLGGVICNTVYSNELVPFLFSGLSYLMGIILGIWGIMKLRQHVEDPRSVEIWDPMKRFIAGGAFFALPMVMEVVFNTVALGIPGFDGSDFNGAGAVGGGLDAMLVALMQDIWTPMQMAFSAFCYLAGIILVMIGISRLLKSEQDGAKGPTGIGTVMTFLVAGALLSIDSMIGATSFSMFNGLEGQNQGALVYTAGMTGAEIGHVNAVINAITAFVAVLGWISFIRGLFIMRGVAEGSQQASSMAGITHILGGAIAINLGPMLEAVQLTLGITGLGLGVQFQ